MAKVEDWKREAREAVRREVWSLRGPNQVVKVVPSGGPAVSSLGGYITLARFLLGKTPAEIETDLGLPHGFLAKGAKIYRFSRLPQSSEYEYDLTAEYPGGLAYVPAHSDPSYPPGHRAIHQWRIRPGVRIPVDAKTVLDLKPGSTVPYSWFV